MRITGTNHLTGPDGCSQLVVESRDSIYNRLLSETKNIRSSLKCVILLIQYGKHPESQIYNET